MSKLMKNGRIAWPVVSAVLFSTVTILLTDYLWRMLQAPIATVAVTGAVILIAGNIAIILAKRSIPL